MYKFITICEIFNNLLLFLNSSSMNSSYIKNFQKIFMVVEFHELKYHKKFDFHKIEFKKSNRLIIFRKQ